MQLSLIKRWAKPRCSLTHTHMQWQGCAVHQLAVTGTNSHILSYSTDTFMLSLATLWNQTKRCQMEQQAELLLRVTCGWRTFNNIILNLPPSAWLLEFDRNCIWLYFFQFAGTSLSRTAFWEWNSLFCWIFAPWAFVVVGFFSSSFLWWLLFALSCYYLPFHLTPPCSLALLCTLPKTSSKFSSQAFTLTGSCSV